MFALSAKPEVVQISPRMAEKLLVHNGFDGQRPLRPKRISHLANEMRRGEFTTATIGLAKENYNGGRFMLVNGQHTLNACIVSGATITAVVEKYDCEDPRDISLLYQKYDDSARSLSDVVKMECVSLGIQWPLRIAQLVVTGLAMRCGGRGMSKSEKAALLKDNLQVGAFINKVFNTDVEKGTSIKHMTKGPVVAAMAATWEKCQRDAEIFWAQVRDGEGLSKSMPSYRVREYLRETVSDFGAGARVIGMRRATDHEIISKCISGWNAYRRKQSTALKYFADKPIPAAV